MLITLDLPASRSISRYCNLAIKYYPQYSYDNLLLLNKKIDEIALSHNGSLVHVGGEIDLDKEGMIFLKDLIPSLWDCVEGEIKFALTENDVAGIVPHLKKELYSLNSLYDQLSRKLDECE